MEHKYIVLLDGTIETFSPTIRHRDQANGRTCTSAGRVRCKAGRYVELVHGSDTLEIAPSIELGTADVSGLKALLGYTEKWTVYIA